MQTDQKRQRRGILQLAIVKSGRRDVVTGVVRDEDVEAVEGHLLVCRNHGEGGGGLPPRRNQARKAGEGDGRDGDLGGGVPT